MIVVAFVIGILIVTNALIDQHLWQVFKVFQLLMNYNRCVEIDECIFNTEEVPLLGFIINGSELRMDPDEANAIVDWQRPSNQNEVQQLWWLWIFHGRLIRSYTAIVAPISDLLRGDKKYLNMGNTQEAVFLKTTMWFTSGKITILPYYVLERPAQLDTDASYFAIVEILLQNSKTAKLIQLDLFPGNCHMRNSVMMFCKQQCLRYIILQNNMKAFLERSSILNDNLFEHSKSYIYQNSF